MLLALPRELRDNICKDTTFVHPSPVWKSLPVLEGLKYPRQAIERNTFFVWMQPLFFFLHDRKLIQHLPDKHYLQVEGGYVYDFEVNNSS